MKNFVERNAVRYKGEIRLEFNAGTGLTRDFSTCGLYFFTDQQVSLGETLEVVMLLEHQTMGQRVRLRCLADVVRVEPEGQRLGVAVALTKHLVEPTGKAAGHV